MVDRRSVPMVDAKPRPSPSHNSTLYGAKSAGAKFAGRFRRTALFTRRRVAGGLAVLVGGFIILNAVAFQTERHPAPLFKPMAKAPDIFPVPPLRPDQPGVKAAAFDPRPASTAKLITAEKPKPASLAPQPASGETTEAMLAEVQRELGKRGYYKGEPDGKPGRATSQAIRDFQFAQRLPVDGKANEMLLASVVATRATMKDELLDLVKRSTQDDPAHKTVMDVQRALNKAGYGPLFEDGQLGPSTKTALARFEQDRKLPPSGEPKGQVLRVLASTSGVPISQ